MTGRVRNDSPFFCQFFAEFLPNLARPISQAIWPSQFPPPWLVTCLLAADRWLSSARVRLTRRSSARDWLGPRSMGDRPQNRRQWIELFAHPIATLSMSAPSAPSGQSSQHREQYTVFLDPTLINRVLELTDAPGNAIEDGLRLWLAQQAEPAAPAIASRSLPASTPPQLPAKLAAPIVPERRSKPRILNLAPPVAPAPIDPMNDRNLPKPLTRPNAPTPRRLPPRRSVSGPIDPRKSNDDETGWLV